MRKASTKWHAVTVVLREASCAAAALCRNARYLSGEAPRLPLPKCAHPEACPCTYRHHEDRRAATRRTADVGTPDVRTSESGKRVANRRISRGRRSGDQH